ncbi:low molecular weight protein-tyrosine-phosphatase [Candidatus Enterovibrio altilux]|uniref:protein-tyrosine-phosphatase n=1 Tax=Candidatus Enterovibrio altilux TaxID=1927128 RepID=A0A291B6N3_9GAMM|nr:low molecular weight protein-tyrosine-phosphatase [Candidatus Enterovibrio luxaltus]ATF08660.1 Low molecular weight protein tyrosine phosphatase [Candidatus Enterovibrio luxaltus]
MSRQLSDTSILIPKILVVCMGNICRSPTGEAILRARAAERGLNVDIDSAGTIGFHAGSKPDYRSKKAGEARGYSFFGIRSRQIKDTDFERCNMILAADKANYADLIDICPPEYKHKISLFLSHSKSKLNEIPDPYFGSTRDFEHVLNLIENASDSILDYFDKTISETQLT